MIIKIVNAWFVKKRDILKENEMDAETGDYVDDHDKALWFMLEFNDFFFHPTN